MCAQPTSSANPVFVSVRSEHTKNSLLPIIRCLVPNAAIHSAKTLSKTSQDISNSDKQGGTLIVEFGHPIDEIVSFVDNLRNNYKFRPDKMILIIEEEILKDVLVSQYLRLGFSGILTKPFSEESVTEVFNISDRLSNLGSIARLKVSAGLEIKSMLEKEGYNFNNNNLIQSVKNACEKFIEENPLLRVESIAKSYLSMSPKERINKSIKDVYQGPSERVKQKLNKLK
ncbi:MAG TPA: hypothetical protein PKA63_01575 [Oligoflexia bacterium]|nr:hypothetical protein [Oligoflexia bacterium]HMP47339.1 hypothetical protein [Oligoflexia bacterium]